MSSRVGGYTISFALENMILMEAMTYIIVKYWTLLDLASPDLCYVLLQLYTSN